MQSFNLNVDKNMLFKFCLHCIYVLCICMLILLRFTTFWNTKSNSISNFHEIQQNWETYPSHIVNVVIEWLLFKIESFNPKMQHLDTPNDATQLYWFYLANIDLQNHLNHRICWFFMITNLPRIPFIPLFCFA